MYRASKLKNEHNKKSGFTLVELAIVIVIIGLIVGGVLVGQDMIAAAEIRSTIAQIQSYDTAKNTFKDKYGMMPGDGRDLGNFGFTVGDNSDNQSDGDGRIEDCAGSNDLGCENALFWMNLSQANLIPFAPVFSGTADEANNSAATEGVDDYLPEINVGTGNYVHAFSANGLNYYYLAAISDGSDIAANGGDSLTTVQAENIDRKMDDGLPNDGAVIAMDDIDTAATGTGGAGDCAGATASGSPYNTDTAAEQDAIVCQLRFRMQ